MSKRRSTTRQPLQPIVAKTSRHGLFLTVAGLVLTAIGLVALIELFPRLSATANSPTDPGDPLSSSRFSVTNDGYLKVTDVMSACFLWKVTMETGGKPNVFMTNNLARVVQPPESKLDPGEAFTVPCTANKLAGAPPPYVSPAINHADLAIVVYYRAWPFTFYRPHKLFRFVASFGEGNKIIWEKQPAAIIEPGYDKFIQYWGGTLPGPR